MSDKRWLACTETFSRNLLCKEQASRLCELQSHKAHFSDKDAHILGGGAAHLLWLHHEKSREVSPVSDWSTVQLQDAPYSRFAPTLRLASLESAPRCATASAQQVPGQHASALWAVLLQSHSPWHAHPLH